MKCSDSHMLVGVHFERHFGTCVEHFEVYLWLGVAHRAVLFAKRCDVHIVNVNCQNDSVSSVISVGEEFIGTKRGLL